VIYNYSYSYSLIDLRFVKMSKPQSISSLLKRKEEDKGEREKHQVPRHSGIPTKNRFLMLAEKGKAARERSLSAKRFRTDSECTEASETVDETGNGESVFASMEDTERQLKEAKTVIDQVKSEVEKIPDPGPLKAVLDGLLKWMALTTSIQENSASVMLDGFAKACKKVSPPPQATAAGGQVKGGGQPGKSKQGESEVVSEQEVRKKKFVQAVREAEKATLVFNLDMGAVAVMNTNTMNRKFSMALKAKAAEVDGNANGEPKSDTVTQLYDTLSMVKNMDYFGKTTKQAKGKEFFSIPVKLAYKDKETRMTAEQNLRKLCKVSCTTPYHSTLRDFMKKTMEEAKVKYKNSFVQTRVDVENMTLRVSYRQDGVWHNDVDRIPLPDSVLDLTHKVSRHVPSKPEGMDMDVGDSVQG
jgi:hypothetical protein